MCLWGNQCDLSISAGEDNHKEANFASYLDSFRSLILVNHTDQVWEKLSNSDDVNSHVGMFNALFFEIFSSLLRSLS